MVNRIQSLLSKLTRDPPAPNDPELSLALADIDTLRDRLTMLRTERGSG